MKNIDTINSKKFLKKIFLSGYLLLSFPLLFCSGLPQTMAQSNPSPDQLFYSFKYTDEAHKDNESKISYVNGLPKGSWQEILASVIKLILTITGTLAFISFTVSGIMMVTAQGEEDKLTKAKNMLLWSIGALAIIAVSYAVVLGVSQLDFMSGTAPISAGSTK